MKLKRWIRSYLGITEIQEDQAMLNRRLCAVSQDVDLIISGISTIIVKLTDEFDPSRQALSDRLGNQMIAKLKAEDMARKLTTGEL